MEARLRPQHCTSAGGHGRQKAALLKEAVKCESCIPLPTVAGTPRSLRTSVRGKGPVHACCSGRPSHSWRRGAQRRVPPANLQITSGAEISGITDSYFAQVCRDPCILLYVTSDVIPSACSLRGGIHVEKGGQNSPRQSACSHRTALAERVASRCYGSLLDALTLWRRPSWYHQEEGGDAHAHVVTGQETPKCN